MSENITLALETGVGGGSLSIFKNQILIDSYVGELNISRSEELLEYIITLLEKNGIKKRDISLLAVSNGPGSYTGLRIGFGVIYGLEDGLNVACQGVSVLQAMTFEKRNKEKVLTGFLMSHNEVCWQSFSLGAATNDPQTTLFSEFMAEILPNEYEDITLNDALKKKLDDLSVGNKVDCTVIKNLSYYVGLSVINNYGSDNPKINYLIKTS
jgi:tRNA threonylcarbamoyl adenosine modification protein YeaZ